MTEWTPDAATSIEKKESRFVSPSFVKDHTHKDGTKIGTTLLAAAITNHPFLEGMKALTLYSFSAMGDLALMDTPTALIERAVHLADMGQRVTFKEDPAAAPELTTHERRNTYQVKDTVGEGDDQFVRLTRLDGEEFGWFRVTKLAPADATQRQENSPIPEEQRMSDKINAATRFESRVKQLGGTARHATRQQRRPRRRGGV